MNLLSKIKHRGVTETNDNQNENLKPDQQDLPYLLLDAVSTPIIYINKDQKYCYANKAYSDLFGISTSGIIGKTVEDFLGKESYEQVKPYIDKAMRGEQVHYEEKILYKNNNCFIETTYIPDLDK